MADPPDRRRRPEDDETQFLPPDEAETEYLEGEETQFLPSDDVWPDDETVVRRRRRAAPPPPRRTERVREERREPPRRQPPPPPSDRALWPWLLVLLALVLGGLAAAWYFTRDTEPERVTMVAVVRLPEQAARERLEALGLEVETERAAADAPPGIVFAQTPGAGRTLPVGATVTIHVSEGPDTTTVVNVVGLPEAQARERLEGADLQVEREGVFAEEPPGVVVSQEPGTGQEVERGSTVRIQVSEGTGRVEVPDVVGLLVDEARAALDEQDLQANVVAVPSREPEGTVVAQNPAGGEQATRGDAVRLNVSRGP
jgi:eukaryotic-like serine/threonine-protein kinase